LLRALTFGDNLEEKLELEFELQVERVLLELISHSLGETRGRDQAILSSRERFLLLIRDLALASLPLPQRRPISIRCCCHWFALNFASSYDWVIELGALGAASGEHGRVPCID